MATPVISGVTRTLLGPLTTDTWTYTCTEVIQRCTTCDDGWAAQTCVTSGSSAFVTDNQNCWPPRATNVPPTGNALNGWGVYSPGIVCPGGYTSAAAQTYGGSSNFDFQYPLTSGETALGCCPTGGYVPYINAANWRTCVQFNPTTSFLVGTCGPDGAAYTPFSVGNTMHSEQLISFSPSAPFFQLVHKSTDLSSSTSSPTASNDASSTATPPPANNNNNNNNKDSSSDAGLTSGQLAGIVVGAVIAAILVGVAAFFAWRVRSRKRQGDLPQANYQTSEYKPPGTFSPNHPAELGTPPPRAELDASYQGR
ncbi:hypothetical protein F4808DRAFT_299504 [Astrocystis sublimbata]|nr:hypothetical protein F4808DRAFT_299504 [Astrocystis sublimbata]